MTTFCRESTAVPSTAVIISPTCIPAFWAQEPSPMATTSAPAGNDVKAILSDLKDFGYVTGRPFLGISGLVMSRSRADPMPSVRV
mgnify:CR=1 FL=1